MIGHIHIAGTLSEIAARLRVADDLAATPGVHSVELVEGFRQIAEAAQRGMRYAYEEALANQQRRGG